MKNRVRCLLSIPVTLCLGCGGGSSSNQPTPTTPPQNNTYTLNIAVSGSEGVFDVKWFEKEYQVTHGDTLTASSTQYQPPILLNEPDNTHCDMTHTQDSNSRYSWAFECSKQYVWTLNVILNNLEDAITFDWLNEERTLNQSTTLTGTSAEFSAPKNIQLTNNQCTTSTNLISELKYNFIVDCPSHSPTLTIGQRLPYPVTIKLGNEEFIVQNTGGYALPNLNHIDDVQLSHIAGPAHCDIDTVNSSLNLTLACNEFSLVNHQNSIQLISNSIETQHLQATTGVNSQVFYTDHSLFILSDTTLYEVILDNGKVTELTPKLADIIAIKTHQGVLHALKDDGLYQYQQAAWSKLQPFTTPLLPMLHDSGELLSVVSEVQSGQYAVFQRKNNRPSGAVPLPETLSKHTGLGTIYAQDIALLTFWDQQNRLGYLPNFITTLPVVDYLAVDTPVTAWQQTAQSQRLVAILDGQLKLFKEITAGNMGWESQFNTSADALFSLGRSLWLGTQHQSNIVEISEVLLDGSTLTDLIALSGVTHPFYARPILSTDEQMISLLPIQEKFGWILLWQPNQAHSADGTIWLSNGAELVKVNTNQPLTALESLTVKAIGDSIAVIAEENGVLRLFKK
ncbi:hypothetical protein CWB96_15900 [Pseudoalteromonas citrea]|uniref:Ig-like domain-containing protein n=2 Tax=Pseudoalteromonas citrea TaxID=43655 RepID=A0A5S3XL98_9GAMM|nr:hypothetical protein CWB97_17435 [Pseudoalteromonas citrea]TMP56148.1 hypothetical protein CWB96_15900 [Pseudoalteromonas citrea]